jgi:single-strand DNA-binding protein
MASVNKVILIGNCGRDPEVRYTPQGTAICNVSVATSSRRKDRNTGETVEDTQWHRVTFYERLAEIAGEYLKKGRPVYVEGRLKYGKYTDKDGIERNTVDIVAEQMQLLGGREGMGGGDDTGGGGMGMGGGSRCGYSRAPARGGDDMDGGGAAAPAPRAAAPRPAPQRPAPAPQQRPATGFDDMDDDIPF